ncbi:MAG: hypothetical protein P8Z68_06980 [Kineosporiaceae bacterium]
MGWCSRALRAQGEQNGGSARAAEKPERVEVALAPPGTPVQGDRIRAMPGEQDSHRLPGRDPLAGRHPRQHRFVRRAQAVRMLHADHAAARHRTREGHGAGPGAEDRLSRGSGEVDPAVSR